MKAGDGTVGGGSLEARWVATRREARRVGSCSGSLEALGWQLKVAKKWLHIMRPAKLWILCVPEGLFKECQKGLTTGHRPVVGSHAPVRHPSQASRGVQLKEIRRIEHRAPPLLFLHQPRPLPLCPPPPSYYILCRKPDQSAPGSGVREGRSPATPGGLQGLPSMVCADFSFGWQAGVSLG